MKQSILSWSSRHQHHFKHMKRILLAVTFVGILAACLAGFAQTTSPTGDSASAAAGAAPAKDAAPPAAAPDSAPAAPAPASAAAPAPADAAAPPAAAASAPAAGTPAPAPAQTASSDAAPPAAAAPVVPAASSTPVAENPAPTSPQVAANDAAQPATAAPAAPATEAAAPAADAAKASASTSDPGAVIPLIVMDDVPLTDAIRNLARQAEINFVLDPKIPYGQVGADGKTTLNPPVTIRWEKITAQQALNALLNNYTLQLVEDPKSKIARVTVKDPAALPPLITKIVQLKFASPSNVVTSVQGLLLDKRSKVLPDVRTSQLVLVTTEAEMTQVDELIPRLDKQPSQVLIETRLIEVRINPSTKKGIDWTGTVGNQRVTFGNGVMSGASTTRIPGDPTTTTTTLPGGRQVTTTTTPSSTTKTILESVLGGGGFSLNTKSGITPNIGFLNADGASATLSFLNTYSESKVLSAPRTVTLDNEEAKIEVGQLYPIVNTTAGTANTTGGSQITYSNLTVMLKVTPRISANDYVNLKVIPTISRLGPPVASKVGGVDNIVDSFLTRTLDTRVLIPSGNTLVMGGLISDEVNNGNTKVPILGDIPVLGYLFRVDERKRDKGNLIVFITPTIVRDEDFQPTATAFLKTKLPAQDSMEEDWSAWDSGQPKDWSKKKAMPQDPTLPNQSSQNETFDENLGKLAAPSGIPEPTTTTTAATTPAPANP
jgi:type II secretory pathway component GspD/PulD (secretin)